MVCELRLGDRDRFWRSGLLNVSRFFVLFESAPFRRTPVVGPWGEVAHFNTVNSSQLNLG